MNTDGLIRRVNKLELNSQTTDADIISELEKVRRRLEKGEAIAKINWRERITECETCLSGNLSSSQRKLTLLLLSAAKRMDAFQHEE